MDVVKLDIKRDVRIDQNNLHFEWAYQSELAERYGELAVEARKAERVARDLVRVRKAQAQVKAFDSGVKPADKAMATAELDKAYTEAIKAHLETQYQKDMAEHASDRIEGRRKALEEILKDQARLNRSEPLEPKEYIEWKRNRFSEETADEIRRGAIKRSVELQEKRERK